MASELSGSDESTLSGSRAAQRQRSGAFATTQWTQVLAARGESLEAKQALCDLCETYYAPVHAFIERAVHGADNARDLTHDFFARLLAGHALDSLDPGRGRFRSYLLGAVKHFLTDVRDRERAAKRGGGQAPISLDRPAGHADAEQGSSPGLQIADPSGLPPDAFFDREWALAVLSLVLTKLGQEAETLSQRERFETLKPWLTGDAAHLSQADAAARLAISPQAVRVAIHRLRASFRQLVKSVIAETVAEEADVSAEIDYLVEALSYARPPS
jgi:RNA polymerase sigma factor (sigma-70 family)